MRICFDHNVPKKLKSALTGHEVTTAFQLGYERLSNGELLRAVEDANFELFLTCDQSIAYQQNLSNRKVAIVLLNRAKWSDIEPHLSSIQHACSLAVPCSYQVVDCAP